MLEDLLFPRTDAGVAVQVLVVVAVLVPALYAARSNREVALFVIGVGVFTLSLMALRTLH